MPGTDPDKRRGEFFKGDLNDIVRSLREIGTGDLWLFASNTSYRKVELKSRAARPIVPQQVPLAFSTNRANVEALQAGNARISRSMAKLLKVTRRKK